MGIGHMEEKRNELFQDVVSAAERLLIDYDVPASAANLVSNALADYLADHWGGQNLSFPKDYKRKLSERELEAYRAFNGGNFDTLAKKYGMTERGMRKLISRVRERIRRSTQGHPTLFEA